MKTSLFKELNKKDTNWIVKIRVARKYIVPMNDTKSQPRSMELLLLDHEGDRIQATIMPPQIAKYETKLHEHSTYYLSNFTVKDNSGKYRITNGCHRIFFMPITDVIGVGDKSFPTSIFNFKSIPDIERIDNIEDVGLFDFIGHAVAKHDVQYQKLNSSSFVSKHIDIIFQDLQANKISVTLWGSYADEISNYLDSSTDDPTVVIIQLCRAKKYMGQMGLCNTYHATKLFINTHIPEIDDYKTKLASVDGDSKPKIAHLSTSTITTVEDELDSGNFDIVTLDELINSRKSGFYWVVARISAVLSEGDWSYISCKKCRKKLEDSLSGFYCQPCNLQSTNAIPRYRVRVNVVDGTQDSTFLLWDNVCEALIGKTALQIMEEIGKGLNVKGKASAENSEYYYVQRAGRPNYLEIMVGQLLLFKVNVKDRNIEENDPVFSVSRICTDSHLIEKHKKTPVIVTKKSELLSWLAKSGEEVIQLDDSVSDNEEKDRTTSTAKRARVEPIYDTANSSCISKCESSTKVSDIKLDKKIKVEKN